MRHPAASEKSHFAEEVARPGSVRASCRGSIQQDPRQSSSRLGNALDERTSLVAVGIGLVAGVLFLFVFVKVLELLW